MSESGTRTPIFETHDYLLVRASTSDFGEGAPVQAFDMIVPAWLPIKSASYTPNLVFLAFGCLSFTLFPLFHFHKSRHPSYLLLLMLVVLASLSCTSCTLLRDHARPQGSVKPGSFNCSCMDEQYIHDSCIIVCMRAPGPCALCAMNLSMDYSTPEWPQGPQARTGILPKPIMPLFTSRNGLAHTIPVSVNAHQLSPLLALWITD